MRKELGTSPFWDDKRPPAVLKHSVLWRYLRVFAIKTASTAGGRRVVYVDAFAGSGRYQDDDPASPLLAMRRAQELAGLAAPVELDCIFVEKDRDTYDALVQVVPRERAFNDEVENRLDQVLRWADGQPLFLFMDPFGQPIPFDDLVGRVLARPRGRGLATEVLLNFSVTALQRNAGRLRQTAQRQHADAVLSRFDRAMGGAWWREHGVVLAKDSTASDAERDRPRSATSSVSTRGASANLLGTSR